MLARLCCFISVVALLPQRGVADVILQDSTFADADWALENVLSGPSGAGAGSSAAMQTAGGNPGPSRHVMLTVGPLAGDTIGAMSRYGTTQATRYEPVLQGAIASVAWSIEARTSSGPSAILHLALKQGQNIYIADLHTLSQPGQWVSYGGSGFSAATFSRLDGGAGVPNFSSAGAPIRFGFVNKAVSTGSPFMVMTDFDNFSVTIVQVPGPGVGAVAGAGVMLALRRRRPAR